MQQIITATVGPCVASGYHPQVSFLLDNTSRHSAAKGYSGPSAACW